MLSAILFLPFSFFCHWEWMDVRFECRYGKYSEMEDKLQRTKYDYTLHNNNCLLTLIKKIDFFAFGIWSVECFRSKVPQLSSETRPVRLAYQPPASSTFLSEQTSQQHFSLRTN
jgi:hypothetical protein